MRKTVLISCTLLVVAGTASAFTIALDYSDDTSGFFSNAEAKSSLEAAAADLSAAITSPLGAINTDVFTGTNGSTTQTFNWSLNYTNPTTGATETLNTFTAAANTFTVYVGAQHLTGSTLGQGGIGGVGLSSSSSGSGSQITGAVAAAASASNAAMQRGAGTVFGSIDGTAMLGSTSANYHLTYGPIIGNLWFDNDTNDDGFTDDAITLNNYWQFDHIASVASGKNDFYSVALHELIHTLGFSGSESAVADASGANWSGSNAVALNGGTGVGLLESDSAHLREGYTSTSLLTGASQEAVMDPSLTVGTRKTLTSMDLALLQDIGYQVVPEPGTNFLLVLGAVGVFYLRRQRFARAVGLK